MLYIVVCIVIVGVESVSSIYLTNSCPYHLGVEAFVSKACWVCIHTIDIKLPYHIIVTHPKHLVTIWSYLVFNRDANFSYFFFFTKN